MLRPSLLPGLLDSLRNNLTRRNADLALFEIGRVFTPVRPEVRKLAVALTGERKAVFWGDDDDAKMDAVDLKGVLEDFLLRFGIQGVGWQRRDAGTALYVESAEMRLGKQVFGEFGQLQPALGKQYECRDAVLLAELDLGMLLRCRSAAKSFKSLPQFPAIARDVAMLVPEATTHAAVLAVVKNTKPDNLVRTELFDVFRGRNVSAGRKSVAYAFTYRNVERTLTDDEVNAAHGRLVTALRDQLDATIRDS